MVNAEHTERLSFLSLVMLIANKIQCYLCLMLFMLNADMLNAGNAQCWLCSTLIMLNSTLVIIDAGYTESQVS